MTTKITIVIASTWYAGEQIARRNGLTDWHWIASRDLADIWVQACANLGVAVAPTYVDAGTAPVADRRVA